MNGNCINNGSTSPWVDNKICFLVFYRRKGPALRSIEAPLNKIEQQINDTTVYRRNDATNFIAA